MGAAQEKSSQQKLELLHIHAFFSVEDLWRHTARNALRQVHDLIQENETLRYQNNHDSLTGLLNREGLLEVLSDKSPKDYLVLYADGNSLKHINDSQGHAAGDNAIRSFADALIAGTRQDDDIVARVGGDEFVVIALMNPRHKTAISPEDQITAISRRITTQLPSDLGITIGGVPGTKDTTFEELVIAADEAMLANKPTSR